MGTILSVDFMEQLSEAYTKAGRESEMMESEIVEAFERLKAAFKEMARKVAEAFEGIKEEIAACIEDNEKAFEARERCCATLLASQKAAARAKAYDMRMMLEKACRALKRRKRLHDDGGVPDWQGGEHHDK